MHQTAFIITDVRLTDNSYTPTLAQLRRAAAQAITIARDAQNGQPDGTDFESFSIGSRCYRFIQGDYRTNRQQFGHLPYQSWPDMSHQVMSQIREPDLTAAGIARIPEEVLDNCWNTAHNLVSLGLENPASHGTPYPEMGLIYPQVLLDPDGIVAHCLNFPDENVFGETDQQMSYGITTKASTYIAEPDSAQAHHRAKQPISRLRVAQFQIDYLRHLSQYDTNIVIEADWNM